jgi:hypothetical protein
MVSARHEAVWRMAGTRKLVAMPSPIDAEEAPAHEGGVALVAVMDEEGNDEAAEDDKRVHGGLGGDEDLPDFIQAAGQRVFPVSGPCSDVGEGDPQREDAAQAVEFVHARGLASGRGGVRHAREGG